MLNRLSKHQQEIAIYFMTLFIIGGIIPMKASAYNDTKGYSYNSGSGYHSKNKTNVIKPFAAPQGNITPINKMEKPRLINAPTKNNPLKKNTNFAKYNTPKKINNKPFIGGPGQPEMGAFKPVGADNMVDLFSGDMSYNIPLLDVGGYPVNIFYNSGITMDQEASWAGLGWNINPGTIMRNMRGVPDDFNGTDIVTKTLSMRDDRTWGVGLGAGVELVGFPAGFGANFGINFNNQRGVGTDFGINAKVKLSSKMGDDKTGTLSIGAGLNLSSQGGATFTPSIGLSLKGKAAVDGSSTSGSLGASVGYNSRVGLQSLHIDAEVSKSKTDKKNLVEDASGIHGTNRSLGSLSVLSSNISFAYPSVTPSIRARMSRLNISASLQFGTELFYIHPHASINGYYTNSRIADEDKVTLNPAYGVMFYQNGNNDANALLDFNRLQDGVFTKNNPTIAIPTYTYDVFSISGEGVGGSFRAYRGDLGYVHDATVSTRDDAGKVGFDIGLGPLAGKVGVNLEYVFSPSVAGSWEQGNLAKNMLTFQKSKEAYQSVYFKNPGEKTIPDINFQNAVGGENLVRLKMAGYGTPSTILLPKLEQFNSSKYNLHSDIALETKNVIKNRRDKRTQVITCLNAEEASRVGFDSTINSYIPTGGAPVTFGNCNTGINKIKRNSQAPNYIGSNTYRKAHHISEINVLGGDGRKYVYGIPVYNTKQVDATFNINKTNADNATMLTVYEPGTDDGLGNRLNKDWFIEKEEMPAYTHSFLLTELVSPNYVDLTGNGISEDDMGDAVKFNYSQMQPIKWRTPTSAQNKASYSEGLKTYNQDDKGHYTYGEREQWYLYSVESKNMVARFFVENDRRDGRQVLGMQGGLDASYGAQRLSKISLYSKGDLVKLGANAKPIKTVHLEYDYSLCPNTPTNSAVAQNVTINGTTIDLNANKGKLTLRSIYFTYNGNERTKKNKYTFHYPSDKNPGYQFTSNDRWGNYKPAEEGGVPNNLGGLSNADFSYSVQDKIKADKYAAAWVMDSIGLPSGGKIKIDYEADDYAYVQDRRAASMFQIAGFGATNTPTNVQFTNNNLYGVSQIGASIISTEYDYIYAQIPTPISTVQSSTSQFNELQSKYFSNYPNVSKQIMLKLTIPMAAEGAGYVGGNEMVAMYADIESFGLIDPPAGQTTSNKIFIKVKNLEKHTPMVQYALQFTKNSLPGVAFPGSVNDGGIVGTVKALAGMIGSFKELLNGVDNVLKGRGLCQSVVLEKSFLRLSNPYFAKYGGGLRVKKVTINDNWNNMTGQAKSTYGQEYKYTKRELINNKLETISSGVASWEPAIGGEENPHREMMTYYNHNKGGPFDYNSVELPLAEMFFPSASVGYSHVEVLPLHRDTIKNAVGISTTDFFTTRDFPTKSDNTFLEDINDGGANFYESPKVLQILRINAQKSFALSQGFKVDLNDMNGKIQRQETIGANGARISFTENYYNTTQATNQTFKFNHIFPSVSSPNGKIEPKLLGRDIEVMTDLRNHNSQTISANVNINIDLQVFGIFPVILPPIFSPVFFEENDYKSAALLKVINHFGMLDSIVVIDKGSQVSTKNLLYDAETGNVLLTRTNNEHDKPIYNFTYPAHWAYSGMGPAYQNIDVIYNNLTFRNGIIENPVQAGQTIDFKNFESGDELYVYSPLQTGPLLTSCDQGLCALPKNRANKIWAINTNKTGGPDKFTFMDSKGNPYSAMQVSMRIIRSGHRNMLDQMVGGITSLQSPIVNNQLLFNDATGILQTTAASFKDHWRVDDAMYLKEIIDTGCSITIANKNVAAANFSPSSSNAVPGNDEPCGAINLDPATTCSFVNYTNEEATTTTIPALSSCTGSNVKNRDVWFKVKMPTSGFVKIETNKPNGSTLAQGGMAIYTKTNPTSTNCNSLNLYSCPNLWNNNMPSATIHYTPGDTLYIRIFGNIEDAGSFGICVTTLLVPAPANDVCADAQPLTHNIANASCSPTAGTTFGATQSTQVLPANCGLSSPYVDVWYKFVATSSSAQITLSQQLNNPPFNALNTLAMVLYSSNGDCNSLNQLLCGVGSQISSATLIFNTTYYVRVMTLLSNYNYSNFNICVTTPQETPPSDPSTNITCLSADTLDNSNNACGTWRYGNTSGLPTTSNILLPTQCSTSNASVNELWYQFEANNSIQTVYLAKSSGDVFIAAYLNNCSQPTLINCASGTNGKVKLALTGLNIGTTYYLRVMIPVNQQNYFYIRLDSPPTNDNPINALPITVNPSATRETPNDMEVITFGATVPTGPISTACTVNFGLADDVWYSFEALHTTHYISARSNSNIFTGNSIALEVYTGTVGNLTLVACSNNVNTQPANIMTLTNLAEGTVYYVRALSRDSNAGICKKIWITTPKKACETAAPFCVGNINTNSLISPTGQLSLGGGGVYGCLSSTPNPNWYYLKIENAGNIKIKMHQISSSGADTDVDFALWGPFDSVEQGCDTLAKPLSQITPLHCSFSPNAIETANIPAAIAGKYYILLVTNFSDIAGNIQFTPGDNPTIPVGTTDCCIETITTTYVCVSRFSNALINPYVEGVFGNWRADTTYSYYGTRKETNPSIAVDLRVGGTIINYKDFWNFNNTPSYYLKRNYVAGREWAWNSTSTQFNRKGYETENKDPLGRFNAGVYGYNQQLPIAVANNARLREVMYDGFEDYDYKTQASCNQTAEDCAIPARHAIFKHITAADLSSEQHHTGRYSLKVAPGKADTLAVAVVSVDSAAVSYGFNVATTDRNCPDTVVNLGGNGYNLSRIIFGNTEQALGLSDNIKLGWGSAGNFNRIWKGFLVPTSTGDHEFFTSNTDDNFWLDIYDVTSTGLPQNHLMHFEDHEVSTGSFSYNHRWLEKGKIYFIIASYNNDGGGLYHLDLLWKTPLMKCLGQPPASIPTGHVYSVFGAAQSSISTSNHIFTSLTQSQASGNKFNDKFSPLQGTKMVLSAWVKESKDCKCSTYVNNAINLSIAGTTTTLRPSGNIIEGWQRYEAYFDIPISAQAMSITLENTGSSGDVFFDDVRIHPFNANEKSFVYHSSNLRLMAELDENNYASFYEYDDDGTLTRVKKETQRGVKTITETRSALYKQTQ